MVHTKSKKQRSQWWADLSNEEKKNWLDNHLAEKEGVRAKQREKLAVKGKITNCRNCFHYTTESCDGLLSLDDVCTSWFNPVAPVTGMDYLLQEIENREGRERIAKKAKKKR